MVDMYAPIVRNLNFPLGMYLKGYGRFYRHYKQLEKNQWLPEEEVKALQWSRLKMLLEHAYTHQPYWKKSFKELGIEPNDIKSMADFQKIPILTKKDLQENIEQLIDPTLDKKSLIENASGGSTGEPTVFYQDAERNYRRAMDQIRHDRWSGWEIGEKFAMLWGANHEFKKYEKVTGKINNGLFFRRIPMDAFDLTEDKMCTYLEVLKKQKPTVIQAYAQAMVLFAQFIEREKLPVQPLQLKGIISSAEKLYDPQRALIERVFNCKVFDRYGSREVGLVSSECDKFEGMHLNSDNVVVEFLKEDGTPCKPGETGRVVVTDLWNKVMPFIRYDMGDRGVSLEGKCSCGRGFPLMKCVEGRTADFIRLKNGKLIHGEYFTHLFYGVQGIREFQLIQKTEDHMEFKIVKVGEIEEEKLEEAFRKMNTFMDAPDIKIKISYVDKIEKPRSGKLRFTVSEISTL